MCLFFQCCGSGRFVPDPNFFHPGFRIQDQIDSGFRIRIKNLSILTKKLFLSVGKYDLGCSSRIRMELDLDFLPIPRIKKASDPGSGSATLIFGYYSIFLFSFVNNLPFLNQENTVLEVRCQKTRIGRGES
jgi:hypothetical protein